MRKLKLSLDELQVESFHASGSGSARGTVPAHAWTEHADESCFGTCEADCTRYWSCGGACGSGNTCGASCGGTCWNSCGCPPDTSYTACDCQTWETCPNATICA